VRRSLRQLPRQIRLPPQNPHPAVSPSPPPPM
jgi:hypothetical protein